MSPLRCGVSKMRRYLNRCFQMDLKKKALDSNASQKRSRIEMVKLDRLFCVYILYTGSISGRNQASD